VRIRTKIVATQVLVSVLAAVVFGFIIQAEAQSKGEARLAAELERISSRLALGLESPLWDFNQEAVDATLSGEALSPSIHALIVQEKSKLRGAYRVGNKVEFFVGEVPAEVSKTVDLSVKVLHEGAEIAVVQLMASRQELEAEIRSSLTNLIIQLGLLSLALALASFFIVSRTINTPLQSVVKKFEELSTGDADLSQKLAALSRDELGQLAHSFNLFLEKLRLMVVRAIESSTKVQSVQTNLAENTSQTASALNQITANIQGIGHQISSLDNTVGTAGHRLAELSRSLSELRGAIAQEHQEISQTSSAVTEINKALISVHENTRTSLGSVDQLKVSAESGGVKIEATKIAMETIRSRIDAIAEFVEIINSVSSQTNLLAMNAAIEAAHAGEAGKGFSVVADEIRKLAESSSGQAKGVSGTIKEIISAIVIASDEALNADSAFKEIEKRIEDLMASLSDVDRAVQHLQQRRDEIDRSVRELRSSAQTVEESAEKIDQSRKDTLEAVEIVARMSSEVSGGMAEINIGTQEINNTMTEFRNRSIDLTDATADLEDTMGRFRTSRA